MPFVFLPSADILFWRPEDENGKVEQDKDTYI